MPPGVPYPCHNGAELWPTGQTQTDKKDGLTCAYADQCWSVRSPGATSQAENAGSIPVARSYKVAGQRHERGEPGGFLTYPPTPSVPYTCRTRRCRGSTAATRRLVWHGARPKSCRTSRGEGRGRVTATAAEGRNPALAGHRRTAREQTASVDGLDPDMLVVPGERPEVIGIAGGDESTSEPHARGDHKRIHRVAGIEAVPGSQLSGEARHVMAHGDRTNPAAQDEVHRRVRWSTPIGLGQHGGRNSNGHPKASGRNNHVAHSARRSRVSCAIREDLQRPRIQDQRRHRQEAER